MRPIISDTERVVDRTRERTVTKEDFEAALRERVVRIEPLGGSDIRHFRIVGETASYFAKLANVSDRAQLEAECIGLRTLRRHATGYFIPDVSFCEPIGQWMCLIEAWIDQQPASPASWRQSGIALARMHREHKTSFGFEFDNFIGPTPQINVETDNWVDFFVDCRLLPQVELAVQNGLWSTADADAFDNLVKEIGGILPSRPVSSLLHGDLWAGNHLFSKGGPALIDPAVYYGDRETDIAMTLLFGGFPASFYHAYQMEWNLEPGWEERTEIYNIYHIINHVNLFGVSYKQMLTSSLRKFEPR